MPGSTASSEGFAEAADISSVERNLGANGYDQKVHTRACARCAHLPFALRVGGG